METQMLVVVMPGRALLDQAACGVADQLGAQGAGCLRSGVLAAIAPVRERFLRSGMGRRCCRTRADSSFYRKLTSVRGLHDSGVRLPSSQF